MSNTESVAIDTTYIDTIADEEWRRVVSSWAAGAGMKCLANVRERRNEVKVYPEPAQVFAALAVPVRNVKVVILGQDPYHGHGQAHGLSFSVQPGVVLPPSLKNIRKEMICDLGDSVWNPSVGTLTPWTKQGVLLLNSILTVEEGNPKSHQSFGWEELTTRLLGEVVFAHSDDPLVFIGWGRDAQNILAKLKLGPNHLILSSAHPSPLSAHAGFFGSKPFSKTNTHLIAHGSDPIVWTLSGSHSEDPV